MTPLLDDLSEEKGDSQVNWFWPKVAGQRFPFIVDAIDHEERRVRMTTPLMWVSEAFSGTQDRKDVDTAYAGDPSRELALLRQSVGFVPQESQGPDTQLETESIWLLGKAGLGVSTPRMSAANVVVPAVQRISRTDPIAIAYRQEYVDQGFGGADVGRRLGHAQRDHRHQPPERPGHAVAEARLRKRRTRRQ